jgi:hypothetical protein
VKISLNDMEQRLAEDVGKSRMERCTKEGTPNMKRGPQSDLEIDTIGAGAEIAFCKLWNLYPNLTDEKDLFDAMTRTGHTVDVKTTRYHSGRLLAVRHKILNQSDIYALMLCDYPDFTFAGYATGDELFDDDNLIDLGYGLTYGLAQDQLH